MKNFSLEWKSIFNKEKLILSKILSLVTEERKKYNIYPPKKEVFNAFYFTPFQSIKVVIIGQDPYFHVNQAHGLAFSVRMGCMIPPTLQNIYKEVIANFFYHNNYYQHGCLINWANQGVLLLNTILTVRSGKPRSHVSIGWMQFTDQIIRYINHYLKNIIFLLWGNDAKKKAILIDSNRHTILFASHPSPLSAHISFFGCKHFLKTNKKLFLLKRKQIIW
ncbi:uracil-DNA glycosylase [Buchnera aphidicola]|uniref:uracil-DNA glycosylase n=1 Tax=Buchnera aphidicola TaxID=9 RepID=UPI0031B80495